MPTHAELLARHKEVLPSWMALYYREPISLVRGDGRRVWDAEGREYLDFFGGILTTMTGYNIPEVTEAVQEQAARIMHSSTLYLIEAQIELAEKIAELSGIPNAKVFFTNSGTEANDAAMMLSTINRQSNQILALRNSYHGRSFAAVSPDRKPVVVADRAQSACRHLYPQRLQVPQPVRASPRRRVHRRLRRRPARHD